MTLTEALTEIRLIAGGRYCCVKEEIGAHPQTEVDPYIKHDYICYIEGFGHTTSNTIAEAVYIMAKKVRLLTCPECGHITDNSVCSCKEQEII